MNFYCTSVASMLFTIHMIIAIMPYFNTELFMSCNAFLYKFVSPCLLYDCLFYQRIPCHDDVIKWIHFPRYWPFVRRIHRLMFSVICAWTNNWANNGDTDDLRYHRTHSGVIVMYHHDGLTHWGRDKMATISQTTCLNAFCWMKIYAFRLKFD